MAIKVTTKVTTIIASTLFSASLFSATSGYALAAQPITPPAVPAGVALSELGASANHYGIPTADQARMTPMEYKDFLNQLQGMTRVTPDFKPTYLGHKVIMGDVQALHQVNAATYQSTNWSGDFWTNTPTSSASITADAFIPRDRAPATVHCSAGISGYCVGGTWVGMGGVNDCSLGQVGVVDAADDAGDTIYPNFFWEEITDCNNPAPAQFFGEPNLRDYYKMLMWVTPGYDNFMVVDYTLNQDYTFQVAAPQHYSFEFIPREAAEVGGQISVLPQGSSVQMSAASTAGPALGCNTGNLINMVSPYTRKQIVTATCNGTAATELTVTSTINPAY